MEIYRNPELLSLINRLDLRFLEIGDVRTDETWHGVGICSSFSRLYCVADGEATVETASGDTVHIRPGYAYLIPAGLRYSYHSDTFVDKLYFHINLQRPDGYDYFMDLDRVIEVPLPVEKTRAMIERHRGKPSESALYLSLFASAILSDMLATVSFSPTGAHELSDTVRRAVDYIRTHLSASLSVQDIAAGCFINKSALNRKFKEEIGRSPARYTEDLLFFRVEQELLYTDRTVGEIAAEFGFCDQFYLSRMFKAHFGVTPTAYRRGAYQ